MNLRGKISLRHEHLLRCCLETAMQDAQERDRMPKDGELLPCAICETVMCFRAGAWEFDFTHLDKDDLA